jgi:hypothetical protein
MTSSKNKIVKDLRIIMALLLFAAAPLSTGPAQAGGGSGVAAAVGTAGLDACSNNTGKALYNCVADVLDRMNGSLTRNAKPEARTALQNAASQLRAASTKAQALSAITQCRAVFSRIVSAIKGAGAEPTGYAAVISVLSKAAALIQRKR